MPTNSCITACEDLIALLHPPRFHLQPVESLEQLRELFTIDQAAYADCSLDFRTFEQWWTRYEFGSRVLLADNRIIASVGIYPLDAEQARAFERGVIRESVLIPATLEECERAPVSTWYASGIVVAEHLRGSGSPLGRLLRSGLSAWLESGHLAYPLEVLSIAEYEIGRRLLNLIGFQKVRDGAEMPDGYDLYKLSLASVREAQVLLKAIR